MHHLNKRLKAIEKQFKPKPKVVWPFLSMLYPGEWNCIIPTQFHPPDEKQAEILARFNLTSLVELGDVMAYLDEDDPKRVKIVPYHPHQTDYWLVFTVNLQRQGLLPRRLISPRGEVFPSKQTRWGIYEIEFSDKYLQIIDEAINSKDW